MTTTNKLDLRTCPLPDLCEWEAACNRHDL